MSADRAPGLRLGRFEVSLQQGDIARVAVDAVVNAANSQLWMGAGVAGALKRHGGEAIERDAMAQGPIAVGQTVLTGAGTLPAVHVIHAAVMGPDLRTSAEAIGEATRSALRLADSRGLQSIAFPALGTGVGGFPLAECAKIMIATVAAEGRRPGSLARVLFVLFDQPAYSAFADALARSTRSSTDPGGAGGRSRKRA